ncbi:MAG: hypothetical protein ACI89J_001216 [Hyphomicrobiaceae bacterium]|jgi:hypothetical protein
MSQLPEVREADATPHIAAIYADIKESAALPQVNLIFRYLATHDGVLEWVWQALRPLYRSSELADAADNLTRSIERPGLSPLMAVLAGDELATCKVVLDSYNSGNPQNLIALTALVRALQRAATDQSSSKIVLTPRPATAEASSVAFPTLPKRDEVSADNMARIEKMTARHQGTPGVIPSMYLHLALWPSGLEATDIYLQPIIVAPDWQPLVASVIKQAGETAVQLAPCIKLGAQDLDAATLVEVGRTIEAFINQTIPELTTVGRLIAIE